MPMLYPGPLYQRSQTDKQLQQDADAYVAQVVQGQPATPEKLLEICQSQGKTMFANN